MTLVDLARVLPLPDPFETRGRELAQLTAALDRAADGASEFVLISGAAGLGKAELAQALRGPATERNARFVAGKFEQSRGGPPYGALLEAFRSIIRAILDEPEQTVTFWRERLHEELDPNGRVLFAVIPELGALIGPQPPVATLLGPVRTEARFHWVFQAFVRMLATSKRPLVVVLDGLQWADLASFNLLKSLVTDVDLRHALFVVTLAPVAANHPATQMLDAIRDTGTTIQTVALAPLDLDAVTALCCRMLRCDAGRARPLAELVLRKSAGSPFFAGRFLRLLHRSGLLIFDAANARWTWDLAGIAQVGVSQDVAELLVGGLRALPAETQELVKVAACIGYEVELGLLAAVLDQPLAETALRAWGAIQEGLLMPLTLDGQEGPAAPGARYRFVHDRVQQAAATLLDRPVRQAIHLDVGRRLWRDGELFSAVLHLNLAAELIFDAAERLRVAELNLQAARQALASAAHGPALGYLRDGMAFLPEDAWQAHHDLAFALHRNAAECAFFTGDRALGGRLFDVALEHAASRLEQADLFDLRVVAATIVEDFPDAIRWGRAGLKLFGVDLPERPPADEVTAEMAALRANLADRSIDGLLDAPPMPAGDPLESMRILGSLLAPCYFGAQDLYPFVVARMVNLSLGHGNAPQSALCYAAYGIFAPVELGSYERAHAFGRLGLELGRRASDPALQCIAFGLFAAFVNIWRAPIRSSIEVLREAVSRGLEGGELPYANYWRLAITKKLFHQGTELGRVLAESEAGIALARKTRVPVAVAMQLPLRQTIRCLAGRTRERNRFDDAEFDEAAYLGAIGGDHYATCLYQILRLETSYLFRELDLARTMSDAAAQHLEYQRATVSIVEHNFYTSLTLAASPPTDANLATIAANQQQLDVWAENAPDNFHHRHVLVAAEVARLEGRILDAAALYDQAIEGARGQHFLQDEALANELAGRCFHALGRRPAAASYLAAAVRGYTRWGATAKAEALLEELPPVEPPGR